MSDKTQEMSDKKCHAIGVKKASKNAKRNTR